MGMLEGQALMVDPWATPTSHERTHSPRKVDHGEQLANQAALVGLDHWATPCVADSQGIRYSTRAGKKRAHEGHTLTDQPDSLPGHAELAGWTIPCQGDTMSVTGDLRPSRVETGRTTDYLARQAMAIGVPAESSPASTARRVASRLNPAFSLWLMGYPATWSLCSPGWQDWEETERLLAAFYAAQAATGPAG